MKRAFILVTLILSVPSILMAEIWKCQKVGEQAAAYTDTPTGGDGINCEKVETIRFTKSGNQASKSVAPARSYAPPVPHVTTKVRAKVSAPKALKHEKSAPRSSGGKGGNHPQGIK